MKSLARALFAVLIGSSPALAAVEQCRFINSRIDREACYARQEKALAAKRKPAIIGIERSKSPDEIQLENDRLGKSLHSICRGC
jgi:hypothetical protein